MQARLAVCLDSAVGLPVWYSLFSGNIQDMSTLMDEIDDAETSVGVSIDDLVLDAGYITKELITAYNADDRFVSFTGRMPARKGFPFRTLYHRCGGSIHQVKYFFERDGHTYFGRRFEDVLFGKRVYLYVYIDRDRALSLGRSYRQVKEIFKVEGIMIPSSLDFEEYEESCLMKPKKEDKKQNMILLLLAT